VVIEEINEIACNAGFHPLRIKPFLFPSMIDYSFDEWQQFGKDKERQKAYISKLCSFNYDSRVIFYVDKIGVGSKFGQYIKPPRTGRTMRELILKIIIRALRL